MFQSLTGARGLFAAHLPEVRAMRSRFAGTRLQHCVASAISCLALSASMISPALAQPAQPVQESGTPGLGSPVNGVWLGVMALPSAKLRIQLRVQGESTDGLSCSMDSLDQHAGNMTCANVKMEANLLSFDVPVVQGHWSGTLSKDGSTLTGEWRQAAQTFPLTLRRQSAAEQVEAAALDPALPPVEVAAMGKVLTADLQRAGVFASGALAPSTGGGVAVGVISHGKHAVLVFGVAHEESIFEIGSITKTFTGLVLAQMIENHRARLDEPVRELLPAGLGTRPAQPEITLLDLATHRSGLPRIPDNLSLADQKNPYAAYGPNELYRYISAHGLAKPTDPPYAYSNLGVGLLGQALADRAGVSFEQLVSETITGPLAMSDTVLSLRPDKRHRSIAGHDARHKAVPGWDFDALAGAGAIRSTAGDMLKYLEANLHPQAIRSNEPARSGYAVTLPDAITLSHELHADAAPGNRIALAWMHDQSTGDYWHDGATGGFSSYAAFNPERDYAVVVLFNTTLNDTRSFAVAVARHVLQRLKGEPPASLAF